MKILYISGDTGVEIGGRKGAATHVRETCHALQLYGHEVLLVSPTPGDRTQIKVPVTQVSAPRAKWLGQDLRYIVLNRRMRTRLEEIRKEFQPDAVYERYSLYQTAGLEFCYRHNIPRILEVNTLLARELQDRLHWPNLAERVEHSIWRRERAIIAVSQMLKKLMIESAGIKEPAMAGFVISPVAVNPRIFHPSIPPVDRTLFDSDGKKLVGYVGTLTAWHGVDLFFDCAEILKKRNEPIKIVAVGGEAERLEKLRARTQDLSLESHLLFYGSVPHTQVPSFLATFDACLIADTQDWSSPTKFFEFAAMARPIVASRSPAVDEVFGESSGFFFERGNASQMAEQIIQAVSSPEQAAIAGKTARKRVLEHYTWKSNVRVIMDLYRRMGAKGADDPGDPSVHDAEEFEPAEGPSGSATPS